MSLQAQADAANAALDLDRIEVKDDLVKSHVNFKQQADKTYQKVSGFLDDFGLRL